MARAVNSKALGERLIELLRCGPEATVELQVLRDGSVRIARLEETEGAKRERKHNGDSRV